MQYLLNKSENKFDIIYMEYDLDGYVFKPKNHLNKKYLSVDQVNIINNDFIEHLITKKFDTKFRKLSEIILNLIYQDDDECDEGDLMILLDEVERLKSVVKIKYQKHLTIEEFKDYLAKLMFLDQQVREKLAIYNYQNRIQNEYTAGRSR